MEDNLNEEIADNQVKYFFQKQITQNPIVHPRQQEALKGFKLCGSQIIPTSAPAVFILSDGVKAKTFGNAHCHSAWACPECTAKVMAEKGADIGCLIDALAEWHKQIPFMVTFTIPHTEKMTCKETLQVLKNTWYKFTHDSYKARRKYTIKSNQTRTNKRGEKVICKKGEQVTYEHYHSDYARFRHMLDIQHMVRVYEVTHGENGWHPHIHVLYWVPKEKFNQVKNFEQKLVDLWWHKSKMAALAFWNKKHPDQKEKNEQRVNVLYSDFMKNCNGSHRSVYFSKDSNGDILKIKSSYYIAGWGGNMELTGAHLKKARKGHMTPHQIIDAAYHADSAEKRDFYLKLYIEYAVATRGSRRVQYSTSGCRAIINKWKQTQQYKTLVKKKATQREANWRVVCWFMPEQWKRLFNCDSYADNYIICEVLKLATMDDAKKLISTYLEQYDIYVLDCKHPDEEFIENLINGYSINHETGEISYNIDVA